MSEWKEYKLKDICDVKIGRTPPRKEQHWFNTENQGYNWVSIKDMGDCNRFINSSSENISFEGRKRFSIPIVPAGTILLSFKLTIGRLAITEHEMLTNEAIAQLPIKNFNVDRDFLYYYLRSFNYDNIGNTSSIATAVNSKIIKELNIKIPDISLQKKIAAILSSLDDKIETNRAINARLEELAAAIFKSWFIDFEPFGGEKPNYWETKNIGSLDIEIADFVANGSFASLKENVTLYQHHEFAYFIRNTDLKSNDFSVFVDKHSYDFLSKSKLFGGEIIISNVGDVGSVFLCPTLDKPMTLGNNIILIRPKTIELRYFLFLFFKSNLGQHLLDGITGGSAQPKFNKTDFKKSLIYIPDMETLKKFHASITPIYNKIETIEKESKYLASLRDTLLPRLMSGELIPE